MLGWFSNYLKNRQQRVVIEGQCSNFSDIKAGVPQGSVLGPLLFLLYINDVTHVIQNCQIRLFADDTCLFIEVDNRDETAVKLNQDLENINQWSSQWIVDFSETKTKEMIISNKKDSNANPPVYLNGKLIEEVASFCYLGLEFTNKLKWNKHIDKISLKARKRISAMTPLKFKLSRKSLEIMYMTFVRPVMEYCSVIWGGSYDTDILKLEQIHVEAMRLITGATAKSNIAALYKETSFMPVKDRINNMTNIMMYKIIHDLAPEYLKQYIPNENVFERKYNLRTNNIHPPATRLETFKRSFYPSGICSGTLFLLKLMKAHL